MKWDILFDNHQLLRNEPTESLCPSIVNPLNLFESVNIFYDTLRHSLDIFSIYK